MEFDYLRLGTLAVAAASFLTSVWVRRESARKTEIAKLDEKIGGVATDLMEHKEDGSTSRADLSQRLALVEKTLEQMPDKESVFALNIAVTEIRGDLRAYGEQLKAIGATTSRVEGYLLERGGK